MYLEFNDGTQLECIRILGGSRTIKGIERDCLSIEVDPYSIGLGNLERYFLNPSNMVHLYTREKAGDISPKQEIGEGYMYLIGCRRESRKVKRTPGTMAPDEYNDILIVNIAQLTYEEYQRWNEGTFIPEPLGEYVGP